MADRDPHDDDALPKTEPYTPTFDTDVQLPVVQAPSPDPAAAPAPSITVPGRYHNVKWWQLVSLLFAVWVPAAAVGPGLFFWWTRDPSPHKTPVVFVVLVYVVACTVAGLILAMADKPLLSALAIAVMSAVFASVVAAAPFYGRFYCDHSPQPCLVGVIPY